MLKTRARHEHTPDDATSQRCRMCGTTVAVGPDGRCRLGHHIGLPLHPQPVVADPVDPTHDDAADAGPVEAAEPVAAPVAFDAPVTSEAPATDPYAHPYDDVLSWDAPPAPTPGPAPTEASSELRSAIDELLAWDQPPPASSLDVHVDELPPPPAPPLPAPPPRTEFIDEEAEVAEEEASRRRLATLLGGGAVAMVAGFVAAVAGLPL